MNGRFRPSAHGTDYDPLPTGVFYKEIMDYSVAATGVQGTASLIGFSAAKIWGEHAGAEFAPTHIRIPVVFYLGVECQHVVHPPFSLEAGGFLPRAVCGRTKL